MFSCSLGPRPNTRCDPCWGGFGSGTETSLAVENDTDEASYSMEGTTTMKQIDYSPELLWIDGL